MKVVLKYIPDNDFIKFEKTKKDFQDKIDNILKCCSEKTNSYVLLTLERPYKHRTTGDLSQNNLLWKLISIIATEVGDDSEGMKDTERGVKMRALSKGYPFHLNKITGEKEPESMRKINTVQCGYLIDTAYQICAELGIVLSPDMRV